MQPFAPFSLNIRGRLVEADRPLVMGILNATPDSFYSLSRTSTEEAVGLRVKEMIAEGADIIDVGGYSSRPGAGEVTPDEEIARIALAMKAIRDIDGEIPVSVDTFRSSVAITAVRELDADIVNDISGGNLDERMFESVASLGVPYILTHMRGTPATMQSLTDYSPAGVTASVITDLSEKINRLSLAGVADIIVDPGFGFAKTMEQNYTLLRELPAVASILRRPILAGLSRKSMLTRALGLTPEEALNATTAANTLALVGGASILRVHDVKEARQAVTIYQHTLND